MKPRRQFTDQQIDKMVNEMERFDYGPNVWPIVSDILHEQDRAAMRELLRLATVSVERKPKRVRISRI